MIQRATALMVVLLMIPHTSAAEPAAVDREPLWVIVGYSDGTKATRTASQLTAEQKDSIHKLLADPSPAAAADAGASSPLPANTIRVPVGQPIPWDKMRDGGTLALERGGAWINPKGKPVVDWRWSNARLTAYGDPTRPKPALRAALDGIYFGAAGVHDVTIESVRIDSTGGLADGVRALDLDRPDANGINIKKPVTNLRGFDLVIAGFAYDLAYQHQAGAARSKASVWQNCRFLDAWATDNPYHGQGAYVAFADDVQFLDCAFIGNGRVPGTDAGNNGFKHGDYVQGGKNIGATRVRFVRCVALNNASYGIMDRGEEGQVVDCFIANNRVGILVNGAAPSRVTGNVIIAGDGLAKGYGDSAWGGGGVDAHVGDGIISDNLLILPRGLTLPAKFAKPALNITPRADQDWAFAGPVKAVGARNVALGWPAGKAAAGAPTVALDKADLPSDADFTWLADFEQRVRTGDPAATAPWAIAKTRATVHR